MLPPGSTIGIVGGGQLGRMMAIAAARLGFRCHVLASDEKPCGAEVAGDFTRARYDDAEAIAAFAASCDVVTYEFENLPVGPLVPLGDKLRPGTRSLEIAQDRATEKRFLERVGARIARWAAVDDEQSLAGAVETVGLPLVLKTRRLGYDGKGQCWVRSADEARAAWRSIGDQPAVAESAIDFAAEFSVLVARTEAGEVKAWDSPRNVHDDGILRRSIVPGGDVIAAHADEAVAMARIIAEQLQHIGVLTVEFFACADGPLVNEIAPRVHNSGHWTIEGAVTSQFEQHVRAVCGLPLGDTSIVGGGSTMDNLIGDDVESWTDLVAEPGAHLHLYGKGEARPGRKMGHVTRLSRRA
ncbi:MAG TPA: 5-(carboxyamino)imidazole ribonucleotide synthase [Sphingomicrobium sp.]|nr:5-(carboxyamino)imidazole ribonucleotide synthase [Sphingomicrobium sp.]